ncbi:MAG: class I SAM-dependent methyltransferase [Candidatus Omnitrophica bacterium]|nr:class I SAM-dependent methyltransferase [Candidatus Omnitrophota bacterium]
MNKDVLPESADWNRFWSLDQTKKFTQVSWSKRRMIKILSSYLKPEHKVLDAGCGSGFFSKYFCDQNMQVYSLDYSQEALRIAEVLTSGKAKTMQKDLLNDPLQKDLNVRFDVIFSDGLLEHFSNKDQDKIIGNLKSVLAENGYLITFVPNKWSPWQWIRPFFMPGIQENPFAMKELADVNVRNGLVVINQGGINMFPFCFSPDKILGEYFGMLLFTVSKKK